MNEVILEKAILAFCREAHIHRTQVHSLNIGGNTMLWVKPHPSDPVSVMPTPARSPHQGAYA